MGGTAVSESKHTDRGYAPAVATTATEAIIAAAKAAGVEVTVTQRPQGQGEIVLLPSPRAQGSRDGNKPA